MDSLTKANISTNEIYDLVQKVLGWDNPQMKISALTGGCFNSSYRVEQNEENTVIIKIGPPVDVELLSYEEEMMATELRIHHLIEQLPRVRVPKIIHKDLSCEIIPYPFFIMSSLKGHPLNSVENIPEKDKIRIYKTLARFMAEIHRIKEDHFGYTLMQDQLKEKDYFQAYAHMVEVILSDGRKRGIQLPAKETRILSCIEKYKTSFDEEKEPLLVHYDLWAGNLFVEKNAEGSWKRLSISNEDSMEILLRTSFRF